MAKFKAPDNMWNNSTDQNSQVHHEWQASTDMYHEEGDPERGCVKGSNFIGEYMFELWKNQCLCDVQLQVDGKSFLAHKIVLAAFSDVFCPSQPRIKPTVCIDLPATTPDAVYQILMYLYTSEMHLTDCNLEAVLNAACFMGITDIVDMIKAILDRPTVDNVGLYMGIRKRQGMPHSLIDFQKLCQDHFAELVDTRPFLCLSFEELEKLLQNPYLLVNSEMDTVRGVISWLEYNPLGRTQHTARLLELINLECVDTTELVRLKEEKQHLFNDINALDVIMEALIKRAKACAEKGKPDPSYYAPGDNINQHCDHGQEGKLTRQQGVSKEKSTKGRKKTCFKYAKDISNNKKCPSHLEVTTACNPRKTRENNSHSAANRLPASPSNNGEPSWCEESSDSESTGSSLNQNKSSNAVQEIDVSSLDMPFPLRNSFGGAANQEDSYLIEGKQRKTEVVQMSLPSTTKLDNLRFHELDDNMELPIQNDFCNYLQLPCMSGIAPEQKRNRCIFETRPLRQISQFTENPSNTSLISSAAINCVEDKHLKHRYNISTCDICERKR